MGLAVLGDDVGHIDQIGFRAVDRIDDPGNHQRRDHRGVQAAGSEDDLVGRLDGEDGRLGGFRICRGNTDVLDRTAGERDVDLTLDRQAVDRRLELEV